MTIQSELPVDTYLKAMRASMESFFAFGEERLIGTILGPFFSVTYCSGYEHNRRITNEKSRAIGFARKKGSGTEVRCIRLKGMTNPVSLVLLFGLCMAMCLMTGKVTVREPVAWWTSLLVTAIMAIVTAFQDSITEQGQAGSETLTRFLHNPENFSRWY